VKLRPRRTGNVEHGEDLRRRTAEVHVRWKRRIGGRPAFNLERPGIVVPTCRHDVHHRRPLGPGYRGRAIEHALDKSALGVVSFVRRPRQDHLHGQHPVGIVALRTVEEPVRPDCPHCRRDQQRQRERDFGNDEGAADSLASASGAGAASAFLQRVGQPRARALQGGNDTEQHRSAQRDERGEGQDAEVHLH
jgi:hypothetical protein